MKKFRRAFIEITNECNLSCGFCAVSSRPAARMSLDGFESAAVQVRPLAAMVSLHVLGEPFMHPRLPGILGICSRLGLDVNLVTNGTLLEKFGPALFREKCLRQVSISLHALSALAPGARSEKLDQLIEFTAARPAGLIVGFRLRGNGADPFVRGVSARLLGAFAKSAAPPARGGGVTLAEKVYLNPGEFFDWPGRGPGKEKNGCLGLRHHFAVLCGGEVVPCCADYDGKLRIGNLFQAPLAEILGETPALRLRDSIAAKTAMPAHCATCGFIAPGL